MDLGLDCCEHCKQIIMIISRPAAGVAVTSQDDKICTVVLRPNCPTIMNFTLAHLLKFYFCDSNMSCHFLSYSIIPAADFCSAGYTVVKEKGACIGDPAYEEQGQYK